MIFSCINVYTPWGNIFFNKAKSGYYSVTFIKKTALETFYYQHLSFKE